MLTTLAELKDVLTMTEREIVRYLIPAGRVTAREEITRGGIFVHRAVESTKPRIFVVAGDIVRQKGNGPLCFLTLSYVPEHPDKWVWFNRTLAEFGVPQRPSAVSTESKLYLYPATVDSSLLEQVPHSV